jgi:ribose transport system permease protein
MSDFRIAADRWRSFRPTQEGVVFGITVVLFIAFSLFLPRFLTTGNILTLLNNVSTLGMLAIGMGMIVVGRGIDLTMIAVMVIGVSFSIWLSTVGVPFGWALLVGGALVVAIGTVTGILVAVAEISPIFATLALASVVYGAGRLAFKSDVVYAPSGYAWFSFLGSGTVFGIPVSIYATAVVALIVALFLRKTRFGRFVYAVGDNPAAARTFGLPTRPVIIAQYAGSALIAFLAGILICSLVSGINTRIYNSSLIYDVLLVVVLGGIGLSGGKGGVRNVIVGTILVGVLIDGMTILNVDYTAQNLIKGLILLGALALDAIVNPRDEQTSQSGDI